MSYNIYQNFLLNHNLTGGAGKSAVPGISLTQDGQNRWQVDYTVFNNLQKILDAGYYSDPQILYHTAAAGQTYLNSAETDFRNSGHSDRMIC